MWRWWIAAGAAWVAITGLIGAMLLNGAAGAAERELIPEPDSAQLVVAVTSLVIFGLPGVVLIIVGWRRRPGGDSP